MKLGEFKDKIAIKNGYKDWREWTAKISEITGNRHIDEGIHDQIAEQYAISMAQYAVKFELEQIDKFRKAYQNELLLKKQLVYDFAKWLSGQNFTNPDISVTEWVNKFFNEKYP